MLSKGLALSYIPVLSILRQGLAKLLELTLTSLAVQTGQELNSLASVWSRGDYTVYHHLALIPCLKLSTTLNAQKTEAGEDAEPGHLKTGMETG